MTTPTATQAIFFTSKNLTGTAVTYNEGDTIAFAPNDQYNVGFYNSFFNQSFHYYYNHYADKFLSCNIGSSVWVNAYQHNDVYNPEPGVHENLPSGVHNDLSSLQGLSMFQVLANQFAYAIDVKLVCKDSLVSSPAGSYAFTIIPYQVNPVTCKNGDDYVQCPIPQLSPPDSEIVCQITVAQTAWPGATVANGSVYFKYDPSTGIISFRQTEGFPTNMDLVQDGKTQFSFGILSA
ncbi:putative calcium-dependent cell adhesion molecule-3 [Heterostelium album PN500]|uniref:Putative calcium-dependent cell adhesion molecule-3 n=1 Tax=Heterostelium pallidum (strain ATCC 26659 / Pp 5 / PN500) TaxID=670386 RepID=D3BGJ5_HETP5|nr:putative calcium-dependent cell adhesion molecule-3 [Heterostelium album PN500]EFA79229.1 putative calcium-dependent cell adhesion molecule-3 [Heterostelium album PN500]|eukprot:XP_020431350.1 putative calcium-dependent cell adhesion molecule-3 [Heterostelium album PN500]